MLTLALLAGAPVSQAGTVSCDDVLAVNRSDKIHFGYEHSIHLSSTPVTLENPVIYEDVRLVSDDDATRTGYFNQRINITKTGTYRATLSDFNFPATFDWLGLTISM